VLWGLLAHRHKAYTMRTNEPPGAGAARPEYVAAVTKAGGFGFLGVVRDPVMFIRSEVASFAGAKRATLRRQSHPGGDRSSWRVVGISTHSCPPSVWFGWRPRRLRLVATQLHEILLHYTEMPVELITQGLVLRTNHVFIIPAQPDLHVLNGEFRLKPIQSRGDGRTASLFSCDP
jgi:hypothetical protein